MKVLWRKFGLKFDRHVLVISIADMNMIVKSLLAIVCGLFCVYYTYATNNFTKYFVKYCHKIFSFVTILLANYSVYSGTSVIQTPLDQEWSINLESPYL